jgi:hypothetical protein
MGRAEDMSSCAEIRQFLREHGLLLLQDKKLPSVATIIAGEPIRGSWWSHPRAQAIFDCLEILSPDDVLTTRLVGRKVTFVARPLWPALLAVATSHAPWQSRGLSPAAKKLLGALPARATGPAARELQERLLVNAEEVHGESGKHEVELVTWESWARARKITAIADESAARAALEAAVAGIGGSPRLLPWT